MKWVSRQFEFLEISRAILPSRRTVHVKGKIGRDRPMKGRITINGRDEVSIDRIVAIKSDPSDFR